MFLSLREMSTLSNLFSFSWCHFLELFDSLFKKILRDIKNAVDPNHIMAPAQVFKDI